MKHGKGHVSSNYHLLWFYGFASSYTDLSFSLFYTERTENKAPKGHVHPFPPSRPFIFLLSPFTLLSLLSDPSLSRQISLLRLEITPHSTPGTPFPFFLICVSAWILKFQLSRCLIGWTNNDDLLRLSCLCCCRLIFRLINVNARGSGDRFLGETGNKFVSVFEIHLFFWDLHWYIFTIFANLSV